MKLEFEIPYIAFEAAHKVFCDLYPNSQDNFVKHFAAINEQYPEPGTQRETAYAKKMKEIISQREDASYQLSRIDFIESQANEAFLEMKSLGQRMQEAHQRLTSHLQ